VRILLVDDDDMVRETLAAQLEDLGFGMLVASSGAEAVALLEAGEEVDTLVSDLSMPDMNVSRPSRGRGRCGRSCHASC
jgi:CheY-like chemotaxis protein